MFYELTFYISIEEAHLTTVGMRACFMPDIIKHFFNSLKGKIIPVVK